MSVFFFEKTNRKGKKIDDNDNDDDDDDHEVL